MSSGGTCHYCGKSDCVCIPSGSLFIPQDEGRPPLGAMPQHIWRSLRTRDLIGAIGAIGRYVEECKYGHEMLDWVDELREHLDWEIYRTKSE